MANITRELNHGPLAERSPTAKRLDFGEGKRGIAHNLRRLRARGQRALFCAHIRKETGNETSSMRCAFIAHAEALTLGHGTTAKGIEEKFGLPRWRVRRRVDAAIKLHLSEGRIGNAHDLLSEYGPEERAKEVTIMLLAEEIYEGHSSEGEREQAISFYQEHYALSDADIREAKISAAAKMLAKYANAQVQASLLGADAVPANYPPLKERAVSLLSSKIDKEEAILSAALLVLAEAPIAGAYAANVLLAEFGLFEKRNAVFQEAVIRLHEQENHIDAFRLAIRTGVLESIEESGKLPKLQELAVLDMIREGQHQDAREAAEEMGSNDLGQLNDAVEFLFWDLTRESV